MKWFILVLVSSSGRASIKKMETCRSGTMDFESLDRLCIKMGDNYACRGMEKYLVFTFDSKDECDKALAKAIKSQK